MLTENDKLKHLYNRAAYGCTLAEVPIKSNLSANISKLLQNNNNYKKLEVISLDEIEKAKEKMKSTDKNASKGVRRLMRDNIAELNNLWLNEMIHSEAQLQEKMALFWHGHFSCRSVNPYFVQLYLDIIRKNALGNFATLLKEISITPAMLQFLNNQQNKKDHPNENFAREVMELFTLGRGNYTEQDIKEAARAFTGFSADATGTFKFKKNQHDFGSKTFQGKTGNFSGYDILQIILDKKECAYFITKKIYTFFVNDNVDEAIINQLAANFYASKYDIKSLLKEIFSSDWFYDEKNIGVKIKSPIELMAGWFRTVPTTFQDNKSYIFLQQTLDQVLFYPPNVSGWKGGRSWIDSSSLLFRMRFPQIIYYDKEVEISPKVPTPEQGAMKMTSMFVENLASKKLNAQSDWSTALSYFSKSSTISNDVANQLLAKPINATALKCVQNNIDNSTKQASIKSAILEVMSLPEYQLC